ncbi:PREDICTED: zinc finger protein 280B-like isoform X1 [Dipodomys ordii]|uniref:Zinc finger protein 280B-like isoform X1 n=1 Tax=Dipodomys ordii TaxID=10020 RepID=A0A1S3GGC2_DIPOR|nr:PREDICTED: zinc finger protein 280B-like isoform X1 [Dipodomys ordii]
MDQPCLLSEEEHDPEPQKSLKETQQIDDEDAELIFVGVEHVNEDSELIFVGVTSNSKPIISNILNRVTPGSCSRRKKYGRLRKNTYRSQPTSLMVPRSDTASRSESRSTDSPIIIEPLPNADKNNSPQASLSKPRSTDSPIVIETLCNPGNLPPAPPSKSRSTDSPIIIETWCNPGNSPPVSPSKSRSSDSPVIIIETLGNPNNSPQASPSKSRLTDSPIIIETLSRPEYKNNLLQASLSVARSTDSPIILEPLSKSDYRNNLPQVVPVSSSELHSPLVTFTSSWHQPGRATLSVEGVNESPCVAKQCSSEVSSLNPQTLEFSDGHTGRYSSALSPSGAFHIVNPHQIPPSNGIHASLNHLQTGASFPKDNVHFKPLHLNPGSNNVLAKPDFANLESPDNTSDPNKGNLVVLLSDFYYGQHKGDGQPKQKTYTTFKCLSCLKVLKNVKFMNHVKRHLEFEKQWSDSWENPTTCQHCHRQFPTPFQLERHIDNVHTTQELSTVCRICELSFETDQLLLEHMKDNHKPGELPYVCQVCNYRSSVFADVETHFRKCHANTKNLLCPFCLKIFKAGTPYVCHFRGHWERNVHRCSKCRLQFLTFKEKMEHKTRYHQMFKKPKQLEGLPPETKVVIQVSLGPVQPGSEKVASITVSTTDSEPSSPSPKSKKSKNKTLTPVLVNQKQVFPSK